MIRRIALSCAGNAMFQWQPRDASQLREIRISEN
jgi:hypothetical protein